MESYEFKNKVYDGVDEILKRMASGELLNWPKMPFRPHSAEYGYAKNILLTYNLVAPRDHNSVFSNIDLLPDGMTAAEMDGGIRKYIEFKEKRIPFVSIEYVINNFRDIIQSNLSTGSNPVQSVDASTKSTSGDASPIAEGNVTMSNASIDKSEGEKKNSEKWYMKIFRYALSEGYKYAIGLLFGYGMWSIQQCNKTEKQQQKISQQKQQTSKSVDSLKEH